MNDWLDLNDFSSKYGVSQSTLRRRIRAKSIQFKLVKGKYYLFDSEETIQKAPLFSRGKNPTKKKNTQRITQKADDSDSSSKQETKTVSTATYQKILNENLKLKKELAELETFANALEAELERQLTP